MMRLGSELRQMRSELAGRKLVHDLDGKGRRWRLLRVQITGQNHEDEDKERHVSHRGHEDCDE